MVNKKPYREVKNKEGVVVKRLFRSYSDKGLMIQKVGTDDILDEAIDVESADFKYVETDKPVESA